MLLAWLPSAATGFRHFVIPVDCTLIAWWWSIEWHSAALLRMLCAINGVWPMTLTLCLVFDAFAVDVHNPAGSKAIGIRSLSHVPLIDWISDTLSRGYTN